MDPFCQSIYKHLGHPEIVLSIRGLRGYSGQRGWGNSAPDMGHPTAFLDYPRISVTFPVKLYRLKENTKMEHVLPTTEKAQIFTRVFIQVKLSPLNKQWLYKVSWHCGLFCQF